MVVDAKPFLKPISEVKLAIKTKLDGCVSFLLSFPFVSFPFLCFPFQSSFCSWIRFGLGFGSRLLLQEELHGTGCAERNAIRLIAKRSLSVHSSRCCLLQGAAGAALPADAGGGVGAEEDAAGARYGAGAVAPEPDALGVRADAGGGELYWLAGKAACVLLVPCRCLALAASRC